MDTEHIALKLLDKNFSFDGFTFDGFVGFASAAIEGKETYHKVLGKLAMELGGKYGDKSIQRFADAIEDATGRKISANTIRNYRWVYSRLCRFDVPEDLSYKAWQTLASTDDPGKWLADLSKNGWSCSELIREVRLFYGKKDPVKLLTCPKCLTEFEVKS